MSFQTFSNIISQSVKFLPLKGDDNMYSLNLEEIKTPGKKHSILLKNVPKNTIAIKADKFPKISGFINDKCCSLADFIIIYETSDRKISVIIIELTTDNKTDSKIKCQFKGAFCLLQYCKHLCEKFLLSNANIEFKSINYIAFRSIRSQKQKISFKKSTIDKFLSLPHNIGQVDFTNLL